MYYFLLLGIDRPKIETDGIGYYFDPFRKCFASEKKASQKAPILASQGCA